MRKVYWFVPIYFYLLGGETLKQIKQSTFWLKWKQMRDFKPEEGFFIIFYYIRKIISQIDWKNIFILAEPWAWNKEDFRPSIPINEGPIFDNSLVTNVTAQLGGTAHLQCKVLNIRDKDNPVRILCEFSFLFLSSFYGSEVCCCCKPGHTLSPNFFWGGGGTKGYSLKSLKFVSH